MGPTLLTGACLCGSVRFCVDGAVGSAAYCHCRDCRRCTGSAFNVSVAVEAKSFRILSGTPKGYMKTADSGNELTRHVCGGSGSPIFTSSPTHPDMVYVKAGLFDDPSIVSPVYQSWMVSAVPWASILPGLLGYARGRPQ